jgi:hypothetical protein
VAEAVVFGKTRPVETVEQVVAVDLLDLAKRLELEERAA